ncbi:hypothetical protein PVL29_023252 [Vitis rotundifolia]|uniref:Uncharacterized protein n=1 Tax=Vitis rotundifolia TaxID=103349 RepID=A0AA39D6B9_VITRO|nr:hypothetical protein PVL29_023252 [Vitis rotundifolia]
MGNVIGSFLSGFARVIGDLFGSPLDFLSGKSCSSVCGRTWDFICYIENFCVANLLKIAMVSFLLYIVLLFFYLLYKLGICNCIGRSLCKMVWACFISCFSAWEYCCTFLCVKLPRLKRTNRGHIKDFQVSDSSCDEEGDSEIFSYNAHRPMEMRRPPSRRWRDHRASHLRKSLRPRSHQIRVGVSRDSVHSSRRNSTKHDNYINTVHGIRVTRTSKFVQKGLSFKGTIHRSRRW